MKRKKELMIILASLFVIVLSVSVAYFTTKIIGTEKDVFANIADLKITFTSGSGTINGTNIEPGWTSGENTFTIKNESDETYNYNLLVKDLVNTFVTEGFLQYKITSADGGYNMTEFADVPKSSLPADTVLAYNVSIGQGDTQTYKVEFRYLNSDTIDQSEDMKKKLSGQIYIEKYALTLGMKLLEDNPTISTRTDFGTPFTTNTANTLYKSEENSKDVYYFAGIDSAETPINNWVKLGKYRNNNVKYRGYFSSTVTSYKEYSTLSACTSASTYNVNCTEIKYSNAGDDIYWRIIRTNHDGSIRLLYSGASPDTTLGGVSLSEYTHFTSNPGYVGYMYSNKSTTLDDIRGNLHNSDIKSDVDSFYSYNLDFNKSYLSNDAIYCNDREISSDDVYSNSTSIENSFAFKSSERLNSIKIPTYDCASSKDSFSGSNTDAKLKYPIGLISADEIYFAGGVTNRDSKMWYFTNSAYNSITGEDSWWTMTPYRWDPWWDDLTVGDNNEPRLWSVSGSNGAPMSTGVGAEILVRPVISLKRCIQWKSGDGSALNPYEIIDVGDC